MTDVARGDRARVGISPVGVTSIDVVSVDTPSVDTTPVGVPWAGVTPITPSDIIVGQRAIVAAFELLAVDPGLGGIVLIGGPGWGRRYLAEAFRVWLPAGCPFVRAPASPTWEALQGGMDWEATLRDGRRVRRPGLLARAVGGALYLPRAESLPAPMAAWLAASIDHELGDDGQWPSEQGRPEHRKSPPIIIAAWERTDGDDEGPPGSDPESDPQSDLDSALGAHLGSGVGSGSGSGLRSDFGPLGERLAFCLPLDRLPSAAERLRILSAAVAEAKPDVLGPAIAPIIAAARDRLADVRLDDALLLTICNRAVAFGLTNPRLEVLTARAARARAALRGDTRVSTDDVETAIALILAPRRREAGREAELGSRVLGQKTGADPRHSDSRGDVTNGGTGSASASTRRPGALRPASGELDGSSQGGVAAIGPSDADASGHPHRRRSPQRDGDGAESNPSWHTAGKTPGDGTSAHRGRTQRGEPSPDALVGGPLSRAQLQVYAAVQETRLRRSARGLLARRNGRQAPRTERHRQASTPRPTATSRADAERAAEASTPAARRLSLTETLTAALPHQSFRPRHPSLAWNVQPEDLRWRALKPRRGTLFILVVDGSGSMGAERTRLAKGLALALLREAYRDRSSVSVIRCSGHRPSVVLAPTRSVAAAGRALREMATGGGTPLPASLAAALRVAQRARRRDPQREIAVVVLTDGRGNVPIGTGTGTRGDTHPVTVAEAVESELALLGRSLQKAGIDLAVVDRDSAAHPADDARRLAALLNCPFWAL